MHVHRQTRQSKLVINRLTYSIIYHNLKINEYLSSNSRNGNVKLTKRYVACNEYQRNSRIHCYIAVLSKFIHFEELEIEIEGVHKGIIKSL